MGFILIFFLCRSLLYFQKFVKFMKYKNSYHFLHMKPTSKGTYFAF